MSPPSTPYSFLPWDHFQYVFLEVGILSQTAWALFQVGANLTHIGDANRDLFLTLAAWGSMKEPWCSQWSLCWWTLINAFIFFMAKQHSDQWLATLITVVPQDGKAAFRPVAGHAYRSRPTGWQRAAFSYPLDTVTCSCWDCSTQTITI